MFFNDVWEIPCGCPCLSGSKTRDDIRFTKIINVCQRRIIKHTPTNMWNWVYRKMSPRKYPFWKAPTVVSTIYYLTRVVYLQGIFFEGMFSKTPSKTLLLRGFETDTIKFCKQDRQLILTVCWHRTELRKAVAGRNFDRLEIKTVGGDVWCG